MGGLVEGSGWSGIGAAHFGAGLLGREDPFQVCAADIALALTDPSCPCSWPSVSRINGISHPSSRLLSGRRARPARPDAGARSAGSISTETPRLVETHEHV